MPKPEDAAREQIDADLEQAGWAVQDASKANLYAARGVALREFPLKQGHGFADYLLYVDAKAAGVVEAKKAGETLTGVETQAAKYSEGLPAALPAHQRPEDSGPTRSIRLRPVPAQLPQRDRRTEDRTWTTAFPR